MTSSPTPVQADVVDLFAGPGGLDVAASWLGLDVIGVEIDPNACATRDTAGLRTVQGDVRAFGVEDFPTARILAGGPPCQTFTMAGTGSGRKALDSVISLVEDMAGGADIGSRTGEFDDERTGLVLEPLRWALAAIEADRPFEAIVLEQVPAVLPVWQAIGAVLRDRGYGVDHRVLHTEQFGVPQTRRRALLVARYQDSVELPLPTHEGFRRGAAHQHSLGLRAWVSMGQALRRTDPFVVVSNYGSGGDPRNRGTRSSSEPAATITGKVTRNRIVNADGSESRLSHSEAGALQTFPSDFPWSGSDISQQIGNAIPPRLALHVLAAALKIEIGESFVDEMVRADWRSFADRPEPVSTVA
ncbi:DNA cytosine methyltransferase [Smaragdicoccus niigatensis]|uniref:DNA cytosine methyltransferase n=1 Tax=Smaragdicoccus niigatensis TaxID=359359 RepID=UPI00039D8DF3|nr:DNA cytosine methyltransferase [Smaragdicoccus niigatensis]